MFLNNKNFFPTPIHLVQKMLEWIDTTKPAVWLEPSAGKWDIARCISSRNRRHKIHLIELEPELQVIAKEYGQIVGNDFLEFEPDTNYDYIIMNPPFDNWDEHLLKAWEIAKNTTIVCLLNAETVKNPYTAKRKVLKAIIDEFGTVEYIENGFTNAERKTNVETALVRLKKVTKQTQYFHDFEEEQERVYEELNETALARPDKLGNIIEDFKRANEMYAQWVALINKADRVAKQYISYPKGFEIASKSSNKNEALQEYADELRGAVWQSIFKAMNMEQFMTAKVLDSFQEKMKTQKNIAINKKNIEMFIEVLFQNSGSILEDSILNTFDYLTKNYKDNRFSVEWWAHNEAYMVGKKFVLPAVVTYDNKWNKRFEIWYSCFYKNLEDIDKALCYLTGTPYKNCRTILKALNDAIGSWETKCQSEFFDIVFYKKGSGHFTFRSGKVWSDFNIRATKSKGWLPPNMEEKWRQANKF